MYKLKYTDYYEPATVEETLQLLGKCGDNACLMAGGTDLLVRLKTRDYKCSSLINIKKIKGLDEITVGQDGGVTIGTLVTINAINEHPHMLKNYAVLCQAANLLGSYQVRNRATIGGNICNASPSAEMAAPLLSLDAKVTIAGKNGERVIPISEFFKGPGKTCLAHDEVLLNIIIPAAGQSSAGYYTKHSPRKAMDVASVGIAVQIAKGNDDKSVSHIRIALGAVAPTPIRAQKAEAILQGFEIDGDRLEQAGALAAKESSPISDIRASENYRAEMIKVLVKRTILEAWSRI